MAAMAPSAPETPRRSRFVMTEDFAELWLVLWVCGGFFVASSILHLVQGAVVVLDTSHVLMLVGYEALLAVAFIPFLRSRGWTVQRVTARLEALDILRAAALFIALYVLVRGARGASSLAGISSNTVGVHMTASLPWLAIALASVVNPVFEEFLYLGYLFNALKQYGPLIAAFAAVCLRVAIHVYQGPGAVAEHVVIAIVLTAYYFRTRRLWPVIMAHGLMDMLALGAAHPHGSA